MKNILISHQYTTSIYTSQELPHLKTAWEYLATGVDMTYFQTYQWHEMLLRFLPPPSKVYESVLILVKEDNAPVLIAPFWIVKKTFKLINRKGCYFWGRQGWSDYLNFIYHDFCPEAIDYLFSFIESEYGITAYFLEQFKENVESYQYFKKNYQISKEYSRTCVKLDIGHLNEDEYWKSLTKSVRQNIRTAINRCEKDNIQLNIQMDDIDIVLQDCVDMREKRVLVKAKRKQTMPTIEKIKRKIYSWLVFKFPSYLAISEDPNAHFLSVYDGSRLCAFFQYGIDERHREIIVMSAGVDPNYTRYSPGILAIYNYVLGQLREDHKIDIIDFTRGDEKYKYDVGGRSHFIRSIRFDFHEKNNC